MALTELEARTTAADAEVEELREELERLKLARNAALAAQAQTKVELRGLHLILDEARATEAELRVELEYAQAEATALRRELLLARTTADIRSRLLDDITAAPAWSRRKAVSRAARVQAFLAR